MNSYLQAAIDAAPAGTSGLVVAPWDESEVYGVAANWAQASAPIYHYGRNGWQTEQFQAADFRHRAEAALLAEITQALMDSGDGDSVAAGITGQAESF